MNNSRRILLPNLGANRTFRIVLVIVVVVCIVLYWVASHFDLDGMLNFPDRLAVLPAVQADYNQIYARVLASTSDVWLKTHWDYDTPLTLMRQDPMHCIRGGFSRTFGTNRSYGDVLADFKKTFPEMDWGKDTEKVNGFSTKTTSLQLDRIDPSSPDYAAGNGKYQTIYQVTLDYADPAEQLCQG